MKTGIQFLLEETRRKQRRQEEQLLAEAKDVLQRSLFSEQHVLTNLREYSRSFDIMDRNDCPADRLYTADEIRSVAIRYRLKFLDSAAFKYDFPFEAILKIQDLNRLYRRDLKVFKVLAHPEAFTGDAVGQACSLFVGVSDGSFMLIHSWGKSLSRLRALRYWHLRTFENMAAFIFLLSMVVTLLLPTALITLDHQATYWSGYRGGTFFHLLFFFTGFTVYLLMAFGIRLSATIWDRLKPFD
jgi:hypothetical protein